MSRNQKVAGRAGHVAENWRCYNILPRGKGYRCVNRLKCLPLDVPSSFQWESQDRDGLRSYIDALLRGQDAEAAKIEATGLVRELAYENETTSGTVEVSAEAIVNFLLLRGSISLPLNKIVRLVHAVRGPKDERLITSDIVPDLARLMDEEDPFRNAHATGQMKAQGHLLEPVYSDQNADLRPPAHAAAGTQTAEEGSVEAESVIDKRVRDDYVDVVTRVVRGEEAYLCRRIIDNAGRLIYSATAWKQEGPWKVWSRDNTKLMLLGLNP